ESMNQAAGSVTAIAVTSSGQIVVGFAPNGTPIRAVSIGSTLSSLVPAFLRDYAVFGAALIVVTLSWAIFRVRAVALSQLPGTTKKAPRSKGHHLRPAISSSPMMWKEIFVEPGFRLTRMGRIVVSLLVVLSFLPAGWIVWDVTHRPVPISAQQRVRPQP